MKICILILKSVLACFSGIFIGALLSLGTDFVFESSGLLPKDNLWVSAWLIVLVLFYRTVYNIIGSYIVAWLAPNNPTRHVVAVGILGTVGSAAGAIITQHMNLGPAWYAWTLVAISLPSSILGGKLYLMKLTKNGAATSTVGVVVTDNSNGTNGGNNTVPTQIAKAPVAETSATVIPSNSTAVVLGNVTPNGAQATYWYEYGTTVSLGARTSS